MPDPIDDEEDEVFGELPGGEAKGRLPREDGEDRKDPRPAAGKPGGDPGDDLDDDASPEDQLGMARRHNRRLERRLAARARENADLLNRVRSIEDTQQRLVRNSLHTELRSAQGSVEAAEQTLIAARDDSDRQAELAAERDLATARGRLTALERAVSSADEEREPATTDHEPDPRLSAAQELAADWSKKHSWYGKPDTLEDSEIVRAVSTAIANDAKNPLPIDDPDHFDELDRRLKRRLPERYTRSRPSDEDDMDDSPDLSGTRGSSRRAPPAESRGGDALPETLTQRQIKVYEKMGFDWSKKEDREAIIGQERRLVEERRDRRHG